MVDLEGGGSSEGKESDEDDGEQHRSETGGSKGTNGLPTQATSSPVSKPVQALKKAPALPPPAAAAPAARGLCVGLTWLQSGGQALQVRRMGKGGDAGRLCR